MDTPPHNNLDTPPLDLADIRLTTAPITWTPECPHHGDDVDEFPFIKNITVWIHLQDVKVGYIAVTHVDTDSDQLEGPANLAQGLDDWSAEMGDFGEKIMGRDGFMMNQFLDGEDGSWEDEAAHLYCTPFLYVPGIKIEPQYRRRGIGRWALQQLLKLPVFSDAICVFLWFDPADKGLRRFYKRARFSRLGKTEYYGLSNLMYTTDSDADGLQDED